MKKLLALVAVLGLSVVAIGCGSSSTSSTVKAGSSSSTHNK